jgi:hypothetical protein
MDGYFPNQDINLADFPGGLPNEVERSLGLETGSTKKRKGKNSKESTELKPTPYKVEDCYQITAGSLSRYLLRPQVNSAGVLGTKSGSGRVWNKWGNMSVQYEVIADDYYPRVAIQYSAKHGWQRQELAIVQVPTLFGDKPYLTCGCGHRGHLYLRPDYDFWYCRECLNLGYELCSVNTKTYFGSMAYFIYRHQHLELTRAKFEHNRLGSRGFRVDYAGKLTRPARALVNKARKWKMSDKLRSELREMEAKIKAKV